MKGLLFSSTVVFLLLVVISGLYLLSSPYVSEQPSSAVLGVQSAQIDGTIVAQNFLLVETVINNIQNNNDGTFTIDYAFSITNNSNKKIFDLTAQNDLDAAFAPLKYSVLKVQSPNLSINGNFDGETNFELLSGLDSIEPGGVQTISMSVLLNHESNPGPFRNEITVQGKFTPSSSAGEEDEADIKVPEPEPVEPQEEVNPVEEGEEIAPEPTIPPAPPFNLGYEPETDLTEREFILWVYDIGTREKVFELKDGDVIDIANMSSKDISIVVDIYPGTKGSVKFEDSGGYFYKENFAPFSIDGEYHWNNQLPEPWAYQLRDYSLTVTAYALKNLQGEIIGRKDINFSIVDTSTRVVPIPDNQEEDLVIEEKSETYDTTSESSDISFLLDLGIQAGQENSDVSALKSIPSVLGVETRTTLESQETLPNTGITLNETLIIGMLIVLLVFEINALGAEKKFFTWLKKTVKRRSID